MKKLIFILIAVLGMALNTQAQTKPTEVTPDGYISNEAYVYIWGTTADTMTNADTLSYVVRVKGRNTQDFTLKLYSDFVSGTAGGKLKTYKSMDGVTYEVTAVGDSITSAAVTADIMDAETITLSDFNWPYLKFYFTHSGTAVTVPRIYIYTKPN